MEQFTFTGDAAGPTLVILGGVHGNEPCGSEAIMRMMDDLRIDAGTLICVPRVNELALERNVRFVDANLNRILGESDTSTHEGKLVPELQRILKQADYLLDLHSYTAGGPPFAFGAEDEKSLTFAKALPAEAVITGWSECYAKAHPDKKDPGMGTTEFARAHGAVAATYECGQHEDPRAMEYGCSAIRAALAHTGLLKDATSYWEDAPRHIRMQNVFVKEKAGRHSRLWKHLDTIGAGEVFAVYDDGSEQVAPSDGVVILPFPEARVGIEWGYLGV